MFIKSLFLTGFLLVSQTTFCDDDRAQLDECCRLMRTRGRENDVMQHISNMSSDTLNMKNQYGFTILHTAVFSNNVNAVNLLLSKMSQKAIDAQVDKGVFARHIENSIIFSDFEKSHKKTALHYATCFNSPKARTEIAILLISQMSLDAISAKDGEGNTALHFVVWNQNVELIQLLLSKMSQEAIHVKNNRGFTALDYAIEQVSKDIADMIRAAIQQK